MQRLERAERFSDPAVRWVMTPFLDRRNSLNRSPEEVAEEVREAAPIREAAVAIAGDGGVNQP
jgi:hypothetical protein